MSPELETRDQLLAGDVSLATVRSVYPDNDAFMRGVFGLLSSGDICLVDANRTDVPNWRWREIFVESAVLTEVQHLRVRITVKGIRRIS